MNYINMIVLYTQWIILKLILPSWHCDNVKHVDRMKIAVKAQQYKLSVLEDAMKL